MDSKMSVSEAITDFMDLCGMKYPRKIETLEEIVPNKGERFIKRLIIVHDKDTRNRQYFPSQISLGDERKRHLTIYPTTVHPFSLARICWEFFMVGFILINFAYTLQSFIPFQQIRIMMVFDVPLVLNVCFNFVTGYPDINNNCVVLDKKKIRNKYLRSYFWTDALPLVSWLTGLGALFEHKPAAVILLAIASSLLRLCTISTCFRYLANVRAYWGFYSFYLAIIKTMIIYMVFFVLGTWVLFYEHCFTQWFNESTNLVCVTSPYREQLRLMNIFIYESYALIMLLGRPLARKLNLSTVAIHCLLGYGASGIIIYLMSIGAVFFMSRDYSKTKFYKLDNEIQEYLKSHTANKNLSHSVRAFFRHEFKNGYYNKKKLTSVLSSELTDDLTLQEASNVADQLGLVGIVSVPGLLVLGSCLVSEFYYIGQTLYKEGEPSKCMYFVASGKLASFKMVTVNGRETYIESGHHPDGDWLGEAGFLKRKPSLFTVRAIETSQLYRLDNEHLDELKKSCPKLINQIEETCELKEMIEKIG